MKILKCRCLVYTSYFSRIKDLPSNVIPIAICAKSPVWYKGLSYKSLAPDYNTLMTYKKDGDIDRYTKSFNMKLETLNVESIIKDIQGMMLYKHIPCLICYEKSEDFCHRHLVAEWLRQNGYYCREWYKIQ